LYISLNPYTAFLCKILSIKDTPYHLLYTSSSFILKSAPKSITFFFDLIAFITNFSLTPCGRAVNTTSHISITFSFSIHIMLFLYPILGYISTISFPTYEFEPIAVTSTLS